MVEQAGNYRKLSLPRSEGKDYTRTSPEHVAKGPVRIADVRGQGYIVSQEFRSGSDHPIAEVVVAQPLKEGEEINGGSVYGVYNTSKVNPLEFSLELPADTHNYLPIPEAVLPLAYDIVQGQDGKPEPAKNKDFPGQVHILFDRTRPLPNPISRFK